MALKTQGTDLYFIDPDTGELMDVGCVTEISGIDTTIEQIETTCLQENTRTYVAGLATPGAASFTINTDTSNPVHIRLHQLKTAGTVLQWAIGWSDGVAPPTVTTVSPDVFEFTLPSTRSWITFEGFMNAFPFSFALNAVVTSAIGIQVSGEPILTAKS